MRCKITIFVEITKDFWEKFLFFALLSQKRAIFATFKCKEADETRASFGCKL